MKKYLKKVDVPDIAPPAVRATFSLPSVAIDEIEQLRKRFARGGHILNRSELIRVGLMALQTMSERSAQKAISELERLKTGRPRKVAEINPEDDF